MFEELLKSKGMNVLLNSACKRPLGQIMRVSISLYSTLPPISTPLPLQLQELCSVVTSTVGGLDELEFSLNKYRDSLTSSLVTQAIDSCKHEAHTRRLLRFFLWSSKNLSCKLEDKDYNYALRVFTEKKDYTAMDILIGDLKKEGRVMDAETFGFVAETLVKLGKEDEALGIFKNLDKYKCSIDEFTVTAIINALCSRGHPKRAEGVVWHHKDKIAGTMLCIYRSILYGWSVQRNVKEARRIIQEMKSNGVAPDLICYNTFLRCLCERNLRRNPSGLVPEALNVMMEMKSYKVFPTSISYNILLSCLGKTRRVKESCQILKKMKHSGCAPDWVSYYLVAKVLFLTGRFGKGKDIVDQMIGNGLVPNLKFYYSLIGILCGVERVNRALELFERMKRSSLGGYGPVYDVLIPKLCRGGDFEKGRELWDEATGMGISLQCSRDVLDPSITQVFKPKRPEKISLEDSTITKPPNKVKKLSSKMKVNTLLLFCIEFKLSELEIAFGKDRAQGGNAENIAQAVAIIEAEQEANLSGWQMSENTQVNLEETEIEYEADSQEPLTPSASGASDAPGAVAASSSSTKKKKE